METIKAWHKGRLIECSYEEFLRLNAMALCGKEDPALYSTIEYRDAIGRIQRGYVLQKNVHIYVRNLATDEREWVSAGQLV